MNTSFVSLQSNIDLQSFWKEQEPPQSSLLTPEEKACEDHFIRITRRSEDGRFVVERPFKDQAKPLGESFTQSRRRFFSVEKRMQAEPKLQAGHTDFMNKLLSMGHMEVVSEEDIDKPCTEVKYVPHHCVFKEDSTTTKLRVVFDASVKTSTGFSLNDGLMVGPTA